MSSSVARVARVARVFCVGFYAGDQVATTLVCRLLDRPLISVMV